VRTHLLLVCWRRNDQCQPAITKSTLEKDEWTIDNKYYTATVGFVWKTPKEVLDALSSADGKDPKGDAAIKNCPAVIYVAADTEEKA
jgi:hypothetical protein